MLSINKVFLYGNLTRDPELRSLPSGQAVANFSIATNRSFKNKEGQQQEQTEFHNIVAFGRTAEVIGQYLKKGRPIFIDGRIQTRTWEKDGAKQYRTEVVVDSFQFGPQAATQGQNRANEGTPEGQQEEEIGAEEVSPEDIPF